MYKVASDRRQAALHRGNPLDWVNGQERLTLEQQHRQAQDECRILEARIKAATGEERKRLGLQKFDAQTRCNAIKKQLFTITRSDGVMVAQIFQRLAAEMLPKPLFEAIRGAAERMYLLEKDAPQGEEEAG